MKNPNNLINNRGKEMKYYRNKEKGFTMVELMIVMAIGAVLSVLGLNLYQTNANQADLESEVRNMSTLVPLVKQTFMSAQGNYEGLSNEVMIRSDSFPDSMKVPNNNQLIRHSWQDDGIELDSENMLGNEHDAFSVTYKDVPAGVCQDLVSRIYTSFDAVTVGGVDVETVADISNGCSSGDTIDLEFMGR